MGATSARAYAMFIRPLQVHWRATDEEVHQSLPGDTLIPQPKMESTRAITIQARPLDVWHWLTQIGTGQVGWYSYD